MLMPFWAPDPHAGFRLAESSFARGNVRDPVHRFDLVLQALSEDTIEQVRDILRNADTLPNPYEAIKEELIRQLAPNVLEQLNGIVFAPELGGQPPSQLMKKLLSLLPAGEPPGLLFKHHFILRLPSDIRDQVAKKIQRLDAKELAEYADNRWHVRNARSLPVGTSAAVVPPSDGVEELTSSVAAISTSDQGAGRGGRRRGGRRPSEKRPNKPYICFNHCKWGKKAWECGDVKNCTFQGNGSAGGN